MANSSKNLQHRIHQFRYHRAKEYDLDGDKVDTDEFIYDSDVSVEDKVSMSRLGKAEKRKVDERVDPVRAAPRASALNKAVSVSDNGFTPSSSTRNVGFVPDPSVDGRKIEEIPEVPIFLDGSPIAPSKYEAIFEAPKIQ